MSEHDAAVHLVAGSPHERMRGIVARHLCGWIGGHSALVDHFLADADLILADAHAHGIRFHLAGASSSATDGFVELTVGA